MDGGRRLLRSVKGLDSALAPARPAFAGAAASRAPAFERSAIRARNHARPRLRQHGGLGRRLVDFCRLPGLGLGLAALFLAGVGLEGARFGGQYEQFVREHGQPRDVIARSLGFGVDAVTISGPIQLTEAQILAKAGVDGRQSLVFIDVEDIRSRLLTSPLVKNVSVRKLYPDRLAIDVVERQPHGLWQKDGAVRIVAADGAPIADFVDEKFSGLPFVVGEGANRRVDDYARLLDAAGDLRPKIRAGILVSQRRWTLKMTNGVEVLLPEAEPAAAVERLARLDAERGLLDKDVVSLDLRVPGKLYARLTEEAAAAREAARSHAKGAHP